MQSVLIAGANGFIGRNLCRQFAAADWRVSGIDMLPLDESLRTLVTDYTQTFLPNEDVRKFVLTVKPDVIIQAAGTADVTASMREPFLDYQSSVPGTAFLLDCIRKEAPAARFIYLSSAAVYGNPETMPVRECFVPCPVSPYGWHKLAGETLCREYASVFGLKTLSLRLFSAYGEGLRRQVLWDICNKLKSGDMITLPGTGDESRDFLHVDDVARAVIIAAHSTTFETEVINLASGLSTEIRQLAILLRDRLAPRHRIVFTGHGLPGYPSRWSADVSKVTALGFVPKVTINEGVNRYIEWFLSLPR